MRVINMAILPDDIDLDQDGRKIIITWQDGQRSEYLFKRLRENCPCATCRTERENGNKIAVPDGLSLSEASLVGRYAFQFVWSDNHATGIFTFEFLRELELNQ